MNAEQQSRPMSKDDWGRQLANFWTYASTEECPMVVWRLFTVGLTVVLVLIGTRHGFELWIMILVALFMHWWVDFWACVRSYEEWINKRHGSNFSGI